MSTQNLSAKVHLNTAMISLLRVTLIKIVLSNFRFDDGKHAGGFAFKVQFPWWRNQQFVHVGCKDAWLSARTHCIMGKGSHSSPKPLWLYPYWILSTCHDHTDNWWKASSEIKKRSVIFLPVSIISTTRKQQMLETWNVSYRLRHLMTKTRENYFMSFPSHPHCKGRGSQTIVMVLNFPSLRSVVKHSLRI